MTKIRLVYLLISCGLVNYTFSAARNPVSLTLDEAIEMALANNRDIKVATLDERIANSQYHQSDAIFLPQINASYTAMSTNNPLNAFGIKLQQQEVEAADFNPALLNYPAETQNYMAMIEVRQPLLNIDNLYQRKAAAKQREIMAYKTERTREYVVFNVKKAYLQLQFAYQAVTVVQDALNRANEVYIFTNNRYDKGLIPKSDLLNAEVQVQTLETKLSEAKSAVQNASDMLGVVIGSPSLVQYQVVGSYDFSAGNGVTADSVPELRADLQAMRSAIEATSYLRQSKITSLIPRINAFASYQLNDKEALGFGSDSHIVGLQLAWTLFDGTQTYHQIAEQKQRQSLLALQYENLHQESDAELKRTLRAVNDSRLKLIQQQGSVAQADESLRIVSSRYEQGLANTTDVLMAQSQLAVLQLSVQQASLELNMGIAYSDFLTGIAK
jgi:outer membrane protein TolC